MTTRQNTRKFAARHQLIAKKNHMKKTDAINFFTRENEASHKGVRRLADYLGVTPQSIYMWPDEVPDGQAARLHLLTKGHLDSGIQPLPTKELRTFL